MSGSTFGNIFKITTWGESHGRGIGVVIDGCPAGLNLTSEDIQPFLNRRKPGQSKYTTPRAEGDVVEILSGTFDGKTTGTPISLVVMNENQRSRDYSEIAAIYRPGHADYTFDQKYGFRDYRGGGRSSGRETIGRVAAGAVASLILKQLGIEVSAYTRSIGNIEIDYDSFDLNNVKELSLKSPLFMPDSKASDEAESFLASVMAQKDSSGGVVECLITGMPAGVGEPVFDKLDANLAKAITSIGAVKGFEIGSGFGAATSRGSINNDAFTIDDNNNISCKTNNAGGILGGISSGMPIVFRAAFKPTPSIASMQETINTNHENVQISIKGRHDPIIVPRAVVVVESMAAVTILDLLLANMSSNMDNIKKVYN